MDGLEVRELRCFLAVADELSFTRAAERLGLAQPPLSRTIRGIEAKLGVRLFKRSTRKVELTDAGRLLRDQGRPALESMLALTNRVRRLAAVVPILSVAVRSGVDSAPLDEIIGRYRRTGGLPEVDVLTAGWTQQREMLLDGRADVALLRLPFDTRGIEVEQLTTEPRMVVLPAEHPLAGNADLTQADLAGESVVVCPVADPALAAYWAGRDGPDPHHGPTVTVGDLDQVLDVVAAGQGVAFLPASSEFRQPREDLVYRLVHDLTSSTVAIAWPEGSQSKAIAAFVRAACEVADAGADNLVGLA
ncbi:MAG TPA: LysR family transcriptional regulator [Pseudonocardiaceae bacterium]|jgi:DNA-binding transcriptional LysR family regulator|nr:LysR family transcriptional regulator [Pseudonocardiaceae bacterium]